MDAARAPRVALCAIGVVALLACAEAVARIQGDRLCLETPGAVLAADDRFGWTWAPGLSGWVRRCSAPEVPASGVDVGASGRLDLERAAEKPPATRRILLIGGDVASPVGIRHPLGLRPATLARLLEARADRRRGDALEVIDATTPGWALDNALLYLRHEGARYGPDVVVVVVDPAHDVRALSAALLSASDTGAPVKPFLRLERDELVVAPPAEAAPAEAAPAVAAVATQGWLERSQLERSQLVRSLAGIPSHPVRPPATLATKPLDPERLAREHERARALAAAVLAEMRDEAAAAGARLVVAIAPVPGARGRATSDPEGSDTAASDEASRDAGALRQAAARAGVAMIDLAPAFAGSPAGVGRPLELAGARGWTADGHYVASEAVWALLMRARLLPGVVPAYALEAGQVRDPGTFPRAIVDTFRRDRRSLFPTFLQACALAACVVWIAAPLPPRARDGVVLALGVAAAAVLGSPAFALFLAGFTLLFAAAVGRAAAWRWAPAVALALLVLFVAATLPGRSALGGATMDAVEYAAFATNVALFRLAGHAVERLRDGGSPASLREVLAANLFFPTLVNGPIQPPGDFARARQPGGIAPESFAGLGRHLAVSGVALARAAIAVAAAYAAFVLLNDKLRLDVFATGGAAVSRTRLWLWVGELWLLFYASFNAWSEAAIAFGRVCGTAVPENFRRPWAATDVADFWRRWHVSLGTALRSTIYLPLGGSRRHFARNVAVVFAASALWHVWGALKLIGPAGYPPRAWTGVLLWGAMNAAGVIASHRWLAAAPPSGPARWGRQAATFAFTALAWVPFFMPPGAGPADCLAVFARLFFLR